MSGNSFGRFLRVTSFGESHGPAIGVVVDGVPPGLALLEADVNVELARRRPGQSEIVSQRRELDECEILSGIADGRTLGSPIAILVRNADAKSIDYKEMRDVYRPSHADFTYEAKYGIPPQPGGGRASARETIARVAAGVVARRILASFAPIEIVAFVRSIEGIVAEGDALAVARESVESTIVRCPDPCAADRMVQLIDGVRSSGDSVGGVIECVAKGVPAGWGDPVFDKLDADLASAMLSIPAVKGFEIGSGFAGTKMKGSEHNDPFVIEGGRITTTKNNSGGIQGGISNGAPIVFRAAFKPTATIMMEQNSVNRLREAATLKAKGRHDPCVLPRAVPIVEAMTALVLADHALRQRGLRG